MVTGPAVGDAVARVRELPQLKIGLHLVLSHGRPCLPPAEIPDLVDDGGAFPDNELVSGVRMCFLPRVRVQLAAEIRAQFEAFRQTGLTLDHVNAHRHLHLHPVVLDQIIRIGRDYGLTAVRLPAEPVLDALVDDRAELLRRRCLSLCYKLLLDRMKRRLENNRLRHNERIYGFFDSGHLDIDRMVRILAHLPEGLSELYTHPATGPWPEVESGAADYEFEAEYKALIHPRVRRAIEKFSIELTGFNEA